MRRSVIETVGLFDENPTVRGGEDYDYWLKILNHRDESIAILKNLLIKYRLHETSISQLFALFDRYNIFCYICRKYGNYDPKYIEKLRRNRLYRIFLIQKERAFRNRKLNLKNFLTDKRIKFKDKSTVLLNYFNNKYFNFRLSNFIVWVINRIIKLSKL